MELDKIFENIKMESLEVKPVIIILLIFIGIDIFTGIINAILKKELNSTKMKKGITGKIYEILIVILTIVLKYFLNISDVIVVTTAFFYIAQEGLSILENTSDYISYPVFIKDLFSKLNSWKSNKDKKGE